MEKEAPKPAPIINLAWTRFAILDAMSKRRSAAHYRIRRWIAILGVLATFLAIVIQSPLIQNGSALASLIIKVVFVTTPVLASIVAAVASRKYSNGDWLITRAGAEEILKEIYFYRTILQKKKDRRAYLENRLAEIQRQVYRGLNGEFSFEPYNGPIPPNHNPKDPDSDPGFADLTGEEYFRFRLQDQLNWHNKEINEYKAERDRLTILILIAGGLGTVFAAWGNTEGGFSLSIWVALTAAITAALVGWQELRNIDAIVRNYSKVVVELTILSDHWVNLEPEERTSAEFYQMVRACEDVLWAQHTEYIKSMQEVLRENSLDADANLVNRVIRESVESAERTRQSIEDSVVDYTRQTLGEAEATVEETFQNVLGSLAEEASSELVQKELEAMSQMVQETVENVKERASAFLASLEEIKQDFAYMDIGKDTTTEELNTVLARYPATGDVKG